MGGRRAPHVSATTAIVGLTAVAVAVASWMLSSPASTASVSRARQAPVPVLRVEIIRELPHSTAAYTQGLLWRDGRLYESTGQYGRSRLSRIDPTTGAVEQETPISPALFGEGLALVGSELFMLTWKAQRAIVYDLETFEPRRHVSLYVGEGWGLCHDGRRLVMSNGSDRLAFRDPDTFEETGGVAVTLDGAPVPQLNELECVGDRVYANIYQDDRIVDHRSGQRTRDARHPGLTGC